MIYIIDIILLFTVTGPPYPVCRKDVETLFGMYFNIIPKLYSNEVKGIRRGWKGVNFAHPVLYPHNIIKDYLLNMLE